MVAHTLATVAQFRDWLATSTYASSWSGDVATILRLLELSTLEIETYCGRQGRFGPVTAVLEYDEGSGALLDDPRPVLWNGARSSRGGLPWLLSLSAATLYSGTDRATSSALTENTDYLLTPYQNGTLVDQPYNGLKLKDDSAATNPWGEVGQKVLSLTGEWGWQTETSAPTTIDANVTSTTASTISVASATDLSEGQTLLLNTERLYVTAISGTTISVSRGVAGSTAATHTSGDDVELYVYPAAAVQVALGLTRIRWRDRDGGLTEEVSAEGVVLTRPAAERRSLLADLDPYASHAMNQGVIF
jgi:hypothetical protein